MKNTETPSAFEPSIFKVVSFRENDFFSGINAYAVSRTICFYTED